MRPDREIFKVLGHKFAGKSSPKKTGDFWVNLKKINLCKKTLCGYYLGNFFTLTSGHTALGWNKVSWVVLKSFWFWTGKLQLFKLTLISGNASLLPPYMDLDSFIGTSTRIGSEVSLTVYSVQDASRLKSSLKKIARAGALVVLLLLMMLLLLLMLLVLVVIKAALHLPVSGKFQTPILIDSKSIWHDLYFTKNIELWFTLGLFPDFLARILPIFKCINLAVIVCLQFPCNFKSFILLTTSTYLTNDASLKVRT